MVLAGRWMIARSSDSGKAEKWAQFKNGHSGVRLCLGLLCVEAVKLSVEEEIVERRSIDCVQRP